MGRNVLQIFGEQELRRYAICPPGFGPEPLGNHRECNQCDIRKLMRDLGHRARHMIARRHHDERAETAALGPVACLDRIAQRVDRAIEIDAAADPVLELGVEPQYVDRIRGSIRPTDEQAPAATSRQKLDCIIDARWTAGEHDNAIGIAVEQDFVRRHSRHEPDESQRKRNR